jgi:iron-sulfur cluster repair protein YtfE (RIC family)
MGDQQRDVIEVLEHDHREVEEMFAELESLRGAATEETKSRRKAVTEQVTIELVRHSVAEEVLVYPQVEEGQRRGGRACAQGARRSRGNAAPAGEARRG